MSASEQGQSLIEILDDVAAIISHARSVPMSASVIVNRSEVLDLLGTARAMVPDQIARADELLAEASSEKDKAQERAEQALAQAERNAHNITQDAREQASRLVSQDSITISARAQAQRILDEAKLKAEKLRHRADSYTDGALVDLQERVIEMNNQLADITEVVGAYVDELLDQIKIGRATVAQRQDRETHAYNEESPEMENFEDGKDGAWI